MIRHDIRGMEFSQNAALLDDLGLGIARLDTKSYGIMALRLCRMAPIGQTDRTG